MISVLVGLLTAFLIGMVAGFFTGAKTVSKRGKPKVRYAIRKVNNDAIGSYTIISEYKSEYDATQGFNREVNKYCADVFDGDVSYQIELWDQQENTKLNFTYYSKITEMGTVG